jgi:allophanate hydrolase subunit 1
MSTVQRIVGQYKVDKKVETIDLPNQNNPFLEVYEYVPGEGNIVILYSLAVSFNNHQVVTRLEGINAEDGNYEVFEANGIQLDAHFGDRRAGDDGGTTLDGIFELDKQKDTIIFTPRFPIVFREGFKVFARASTNSNTRDFQACYAEVSEE